MLGYIRPFQPELKCKEHDVYKAIYCGLCKELGKLFGQASRMTLSYDFAFLALLHLSENDAVAQFDKAPCIAHPLKKRPYALSNTSVEYAAMTAVITIYYKLKDNIADRGFFGKIPPSILLPFAASAYKKAAARYPALAEEIGAHIAEQAKLEREGCSSLDRAAEPTAQIMACIAEGVLPVEQEQQRFVLRRFGYQLGRWIYLIDALDDLADDEKTGSYNPLALQDNVDIKEMAMQSINLTAGELALCYSLLQTSTYKPILVNIMYLGLPNTLKQILNGRKKENKDERPL